MPRRGEFDAKLLLNVDMPAKAIYYAPDYPNCRETSAPGKDGAGLFW
jgi:hypothetical protein